MKRSEFDHAIRAAAGVLGVDELLVIGSQAIHASTPELPPEAQRSIEVDIVPFDDDDGRKADLVDGAIGEASLFHESFGIYAQGVSEATAILPRGWRKRLLRYESASTKGVVAWCLEMHDLWISKAIAGRPKDDEFCRAVLERGLVSHATLLERLKAVPKLDAQRRESIRAKITRWSGS